MSIHTHGFKLEPAPLRVGIVGHRPGRDALVDASEELRRVLSVVADAWGAQGANASAVLVSCLAEGVDQMAVHVRPNGWAVDAILPFPRDDYRRDFFAQSSGSGMDVTEQYDACLAIAEQTGRVVEFDVDTQAQAEDLADGIQPMRDPRAYRRAAMFMLRSVNFLVAVWDGEPARGPGGTADTIAEAARSLVPVIWIDALGAQRTRIGYGETAQAMPRWADCTNDALRKLTVPRTPQGKTLSADALVEANKFEAFLAEPWRTWKGWPIYDWFRALSVGKFPTRRGRQSSPEDQGTAWDKFFHQAPNAPVLERDIRENILPVCLRADGLAVYFGNMYRSSYIVSYILSFFAILTALLGFLIPYDLSHAEALDVKAMLVFIELILIGTVIGIVLMARRERWREKWLEYRELSEILRHTRFLAYLGEHRLTSDVMRNFPLNTYNNERWTLVYSEYLARRVGIPDVIITKNYITHMSQALDDHEIQSQINYHESTHYRLKRMNHVLHIIGDACFWVTFVILGIFIVAFLFILGTSGGAHGNGGERAAHDLLYNTKTLVGILAAALPALGAALAGIRFTGEFASFAERSAAMRDALSRMQAECEGIRRDPGYERMSDFSVRLSTVLSVDVEVWRSVFRLERHSV